MKRKASGISEADAATLAKSYVALLELQGKLRGWRYDYVGVSQKRGPIRGMADAYGVVFDAYSPSGSLVGGPVIFLVDAISGEVSTFESP
jgi:hypothetical protein